MKSSITLEEYVVFPSVSPRQSACMASHGIVGPRPSAGSFSLTASVHLRRGCSARAWKAFRSLRGANVSCAGRCGSKVRADSFSFRGNFLRMQEALEILRWPAAISPGFRRATFCIPETRQVVQKRDLGAALLGAQLRPQSVAQFYGMRKKRSLQFLERNLGVRSDTGFPHRNPPLYVLSTTRGESPKKGEGEKKSYAPVAVEA